VITSLTISSLEEIVGLLTDMVEKRAVSGAA